jgi:1-acyl-sn-glycerol-3-phosphate acyltransferase
MYHQAKKWIAPLIRSYHRIEVIHSERIPADPGYVLVANHQNYMDPFYVGAILPHQPFFMAKQEAFDHWFLGRVLRAFEAFPVKRTQNDLKAIKFGIKVLQEDKVLGIFPEGGRRQEKDFSDLKLGAAYFAQKTGKPIVPMYIAGSEQAVPKKNSLPRPVKIRIYVGELIQVQQGQDYKTLGDLLHQTLVRLQKEAEQDRG